MDKIVYTLLGLVFIMFFLIWFIMHIRDRRRVLNGLAFFVSFGSFFLFLIFVGTLQDDTFLSALGGFFILGILILFPLAYLVGLYLLFSTGIKVVKREGLSLSHILGILLGLGILISSFVLPIFMTRIQSRFLLGLMTFFLTMFSYFVVGFIVYLTSSLIYKLWYEKRNKDYIIVLGAGLNGDRVTPLLASRIDRALKFYHSQEKKTGRPPKLIMSGGQGADEPVSEAWAMGQYALEQAIPKEDILLEDRSSTTRENLLFSRDLILQDFKGDRPKVLFSTSSYHVLRAGILARSLGLDYNGLGAKTKLYFSVSALIREYIGILVVNLNSNLIIALLIGIFSFANVLFLG